MALRFQRQIPLILGISAGAVIGVALFDLLPEALALTAKAYQPTEVLGVVGAGFAGYMLLERLLPVAAQARSGHLRPAFKAAPGIGIVVALAVLAHDLADGVNTVTLSLSGGGGAGRARGWLIADALAPLAGIGATRLFSVGQPTLGLASALFAGFFLYLGASELTPGSYRTLPRPWTSLATLAGMAAIYAVVRLASE